MQMATARLLDFCMLGITAVICLPADFFGFLWFAYHVYDAETRTVYSSGYAAALFFLYLIVSGFGVGLLSAAVILWGVLLTRSSSSLRIKLVATGLIALAVLGTLKAGWVMGFRH